MLHTSTKKFAVLALLGAGLVIGKNASAASIVQNFTINTQNVGFTQNFTFNKFDTSLGTLNSVTIFLSTSATAEVDVFNTTGSPQSFTNATANFSVTATGPSAANVNINLTAGPFSSTANPGANAFPGLTTADSNSVSVPFIQFSSYQGAGSGTANLSVVASNGSYGGSAASGVFFGGSASAGGSVTLTYNYTTPSATTPEPGTWGLMVAGASTGLALARRRRRK